MKNTKTKNAPAKPLIILTAGGTGGHVYPAEALAAELQARGFRLMLITDCRGKNNYQGKLGEIENRAVLCGSVVGKSLWHKAKSLFKTGAGVLQALWILQRRKPACVVGFGGYAAFPASVAAILCGIDLIIHEQNSVMSRTNRFLSRYATLIAKSFRRTKYLPENVKTIHSGMPVRQSIVDCRNNYGAPQSDEKIELMILGGSQGAKVFGEVIPQAVKILPAELRRRLRVYQQCRRGEEDNLRRAYEGSACELEVSHFFADMAGLYSRLHLIISRSGASSVSEIAAAGIPSLLVPLPYAADDHQTFNAAELGSVGAAVVIPQSEFTAEKAAAILTEILTDPAKAASMADKAKKTAITDAAGRLADAVEKQITTHK